jgi:hypothetical protein
LALDQPVGGCAAGQWAFLLARPPLPGQLGAALLAATLECVAVMGEQG